MSLMFFFFKQKTAYEMRISDWSSDVCSSDLTNGAGAHGQGGPDLRTVAALLPTPTTTQRGTDANLDTREGARANLHNTAAEHAQDWRELGSASCRGRVCPSG